PAFWITNGNGRAAGEAIVDVESIAARRNVACEEVSQGTKEGAVYARRASCPGAGRSIKDELSRSATVIELIEFPVAEFGSVTELVLPDAVGNDVGKVQGEVAPAFGGSQTNLFKSSRSALGRRRDDNIGSSENGLPVVGGVRAKEYSHGLGIEAVVVVVKKLVEVDGAKKELIGPPR